ncbi:MAG TPA: amidohydrolase family protein [Mycobacteriales bacterium]|nr:amidohydrolase family protein [Mycobacteriales bacterium]
MIDDHVHPFGLEFTPFDPAALTLDVEPGEPAAQRRRRLAPGRLHLHLLQARLARLLGVHVNDAVAARDETARGDWPGWVRRLFDDAEITGFVMDEAVGGTPGPVTRYVDVAGRPFWSLARIDPLVDELIGSGASAAEIVDGVETFMQAAADGGCVGFKTILAYRTGLAVDPEVDLAAAQRSLDSDLPVRRRAKPLRDLVLRGAFARAADLNLPFQVHTGFGDSELRLAEADPLLLEDLLRTPEGAAATVVLIHGSFPWHASAAYLAATKPNVWVELSLSNLFAPVGVADRLLGILDLAPTGRVLLGSDGHGAPETHWFGCSVLADAWRDVAGRLLDAGADAGWVTATRDAIFENNAREVYQLN